MRSVTTKSESESAGSITTPTQHVAKVARAFFAGLAIYVAIILVGAIVFAVFFRMSLADPENLLYAISVRLLAVMGAGYCGAWALGGKEIIIALAIGAMPSLPGLLFEPSGSFSEDMLEVVFNSATGALGGTIRYATTHSWHEKKAVRISISFALTVVGYFLGGIRKQTAIRWLVASVLTVTGYIMMVIMAIGHLAYIAPILAHSQEKSPFSFAEMATLDFLGFIGPFIAVIGRRIAPRPGDDVITNEKNYVLYLRAFSDEGLQRKQEPHREISSWDALPLGPMIRGFQLIWQSSKDTSFEGFLTLLIKDQIGPVVALMKPGDILPPVAGAARLTIDSSEWQVKVKKLMRDSKLVFMTLGTGMGLLWELQQMLQAEPEKLVIAIPPLGDALVTKRLAALRDVFAAHNIAVPDPPMHSKFLVVADGVSHFSAEAGENFEAYRVALTRAVLREQSPRNQLSAVTVSPENDDRSKLD